jgi:hypothetical protein
MTLEFTYKVQTNIDDGCIHRKIEDAGEYEDQRDASGDCKYVLGYIVHNPPNPKTSE